ncbi:hypothetical protein KGM_201249A, partial [Danaus plexippus plexippus]
MPEKCLYGRLSKTPRIINGASHNRPHLRHNQPRRGVGGVVVVVVYDNY